MARDSYFVSGKFELLARGIPYGPIVQICRQLVHSLLAEPPAVLEQRQQSLREALGQNGRLLCELIPDLELVVGPQPEVVEMGPTESQARFELLMQRFLRLFAAAGRPLVAFLDDLQWADSASLRLLELLLTDPAGGHVLVLGAYRDNEVDSVHPLALALEQFKKAGVVMSELLLRPLELPQVTELLAETLHCSMDRASTLSDTLFANCDGNPFYLLQLLNTAHKDGLVVFDGQTQSWQWDIQGIRHSMVADNVVEFMLARLGELSSTTQAVIRVAACIGYRIDHDTLAAVCGLSEPQLRTGLWEALRAGVIVALDDNYRFAVEAPTNGDERTSNTPNASYRFPHDRVQQAAYALIGEAQKAEVHLNIGRLLLARTDLEPQDDDLFAVVDHLNKGVELVLDAGEKLHLARLNLSAGQKALSAAAPAASAQYLQSSLELLGPEGWSSHYQETLRAHLLKAECEYLIGNVSEAFRLVEDVEQHASAVLERVAGRYLKSVLLAKTGQVQQACINTVETAALLGMELPPADDKPAMVAATGAEFGAYQAALAERSVESLAELPRMTDPEQLALMRTLIGGFPAAFQCNQEQFALLVLKAAAMTLRCGTAPWSPLVYAQYGLVHLIVTNDFETAYRFGKLSVELCRAHGSGVVGGAAYFIYGGFLSHWHDHVSSAIEHLRLGLRLSLDLGDLEYAAYCASVALHYRIYAGDSLEEIRASVQGAVDLTERAGDVVNLGFCTVAKQLIACLQGRTSRWGSLEADDFDAATLKSMPYSVQSFAATAITMAHFLAGNYEDAVAAADACSPLPANYFNGEHVFYRALALAQMIRHAESSERRVTLLNRLRDALATLAAWATQAPSNHADGAVCGTDRGVSAAGCARIVACRNVGPRQCEPLEQSAANRRMSIHDHLGFAD